MEGRKREGRAGAVSFRVSFVILILCACGFKYPAVSDHGAVTDFLVHR